MSEFSYSVKNPLTPSLLSEKLNNLLSGEIPVVICVGTDAAIGDSVGPICGTMIERAEKNVFVYGSLNCTVTAKEIKAVKSFVSKVHPFSKILVVDAAVGKSEDVGFIKLSDSPIKPGLGAEKDLPALGDVSVIAVVGAKKEGDFGFLNTTRLSAVYNYAKVIAEGVIGYIGGQAANKGQPLFKSSIE